MTPVWTQSRAPSRPATRPVIIVSRDAINLNSPVVIAVPCTIYRADRRLYPSQVLLRAPNGGLDVDSVALGEQVRASQGQKSSACSTGYGGLSAGRP